MSIDSAGSGKRDEEDAQHRYAAIRDATIGDAPIAVLHIGQRHTYLVVGVVNGEPSVVAMNLGSAGVPSSLFKGELPTPVELENAIAVVEDEVMAAGRRLPAVLIRPVVSADPVLQRLAAIAQPGRHPGDALTVDDIERVFDNFTAIVMGRPVGSDGIPITRSFVAVLVIIREVMHHLRIGMLNVA